MAHIEVKDRVLITSRFGDEVRVPIPAGGRVEIRTARDHVDVELRSSVGAKVRTFRLPKEERSS